jgi:hypothetical protein
MLLRPAAYCQVASEPSCALALRMSASVVPASGPLESRKIRVEGAKGIKVVFSPTGSAGKAGPRTSSPSSRSMALLSSSDRPHGCLPLPMPSPILQTRRRRKAAARNYPMLQKFEKPQRVGLQAIMRYATSCGPGSFCNSARPSLARHRDRARHLPGIGLKHTKQE